jgi:hypothetical protein
MLCPELFDTFLQSDLFKPPDDGTHNTPVDMATKFGVPYLG